MWSMQFSVGAGPAVRYMLPPPPPCSGLIPLLSGEWGGYWVSAWPVVSWAHPVSTSAMSSAASKLCQFMAPPRVKPLTR